ncbi:MAG: protein serine/threonine phosphatase [Bacteroidetes bacterium]|nr:protein serine/threonine phosphatase [Bacteroidota bacterium]
MKNPLKYSLLLLLFFTSVICQGQAVTDSLLKLLKQPAHDTTRLKTMNALAWVMKGVNGDTAMLLCRQVASMAEKNLEHESQNLDLIVVHTINYGRALHQIAAIYSSKGEFFKSLEKYKEAITVWDEIETTSPPKYKLRIMANKSTSIGNMGNVHYNQGNYPKALDCYFKALKTDEALRYEEGIARQYGNIGNIYLNENKLDKALDWYTKALKLDEKLNNLGNSAAVMGNIGVIHFKHKDFNQALTYYLRALELDKKLNNMSELSADMGNIGIVYDVLGQNDKAMEWFTRAAEAAQAYGDKNSMAFQLGNIGSIHLKNKNYREAEKYFLKAIDLSREIYSQDALVTQNNALKEVYLRMGNYSKALIYFKAYEAAKDSFFSETKANELTRHEMNYEFEKKEAAVKAEQDKKDAVAAAENRKQNLVLMLALGMLLIVLVFSAFIFRSLKFTRRQKKIIEKKNKETEEQKKIIEEKNKDIIDSIYYARRIQSCLLPSEKYITKRLETLKVSEKNLLLCLCLFSCSYISAQPSVGSRMIDSLMNVLKAETEDTNKVIHVYYLGSYYLDLGNYDSSIRYTNYALALGNKLGKKTVQAASLGQLAIIYYEQGNYPKGLEYNFKALKLSEEINDTRFAAIWSNNIGNIYLRQNNYSKALEYYFRALKKDEHLQNKIGMAYRYGNIGYVYSKLKNNDSAMSFLNHALKLDDELKNKSGIARHYGNIGAVLKDQKKYTSALDYHLKALEIYEELGNKKGSGREQADIGLLYLEQKNLEEAELFLINSLSIAEEIHSLDDIKQGHEYLSNLYSAKGDHKKSVEHYQKYSDFKDSIFNEEKKRELTRHEMNYEFEKKEAATKAEQDKKDAVAAAEKNKQDVILFLVCGGLLLVIIFAGFIFSALRTTRKQKQLIEAKNQETEEQKLVIEEKNKNILDSIHYAKRIQSSLLPTETYISRRIEKLKQ